MVGTLDDSLADALEVGAVEGTVSALKVEATLDIGQTIKVNTGKQISMCRARQLGERLSEEVKNSRVELAAEVNGTSNLLQLGQVNGLQLVVTGNGESTVNLGQNGHGDVGQLGVVVEHKVTGGGQVGGRESGELSTPEAELTGELLQRGNRDAGDVAEGHVGTSAEVGELNLESIVVTGEVDQIGSVLQVVDVDLLEIAVVLNLELVDGLQGDTVQRGQTGVLDDNIAGLGDTLVEVQRLELGKGVPLDGADGGQLGESKLGQAGKTLQVESVANGSQGGGSDVGDVLTTGADDGTRDSLNTGEGEGAGVGLGDGNITVQLGAGSDTIGIGLVFDGGVTA